MVAGDQQSEWCILSHILLQKGVAMSKQFIIDIKKIRDSARKKLASGAVTEHYSADLNTVVRAWQQLNFYSMLVKSRGMQIY